MRERRNGCGGEVSMYSHHAYTSISPFLFLLALVLSSGTVASIETDGSKQQLQWQILTKTNFSSQIRLHPQILIMVTVPWSGESRSLMKEISHMVHNEQGKRGSLKLMLLDRSTERMLADAVGATEGITILFYREAVSYKYQGKLRAQNILSSARFVMFSSPEEFPLQLFTSPEDLKVLLESTDKALVLMEFCGWTPRLLAKGKNNGTENVFEGFLGEGLVGETNRTLEAKEKKNLKMGIENEKMKCSVENGLNGIPWLQEFSSVTETFLLEDDNVKSSGELSCSSEEYRRFESFFWKFMTVVKEFTLPPQRLRFGMVPDRSLLPSLGVGDSNSWSMMLYFAGCPGCSKVVQKEDDLKSVLQLQNSLVAELDGDRHDYGPSLPANKPSMLLFIDRSSDSLETRQKSKEALISFRELALHCQIAGQIYANPVRSSIEASQVSRSTTGHQNLNSRTVQKMALKNKMSVVIVDNGNHVSLDNIVSGLHGSSLQEILAYALQHKEEVRLSSLAKEVGFQLISDDFNVKVAETLPKQTDTVQTDQDSSESPGEDSPSSHDNSDMDQILYLPGTLAQENEKQSKIVDGENPSSFAEKTTDPNTSGQLSVKPDQHDFNWVLASTEEGRDNNKNSTGLEMLKEEHFHINGFNGSLFFSDGGYRLLKALTAGSKIPSVVLIDPVFQKHYILSEDTIISYSSLSEFVDEFVNGRLLPYQRSESIHMRTRDAPSPPFVNLDFHELDSVPRVTTLTFSEMVLGTNQSDATNFGHAWKKDVLVLFSNKWCGFCQRMELVVREVYRAFKGYTKILKNESRSKNIMFTNDAMEEIELTRPLVYFMDCVLNDCSLILRSTVQRELYPTLLLFPAESKNAVFYEGDMTVSDIIKFVTDNGSNSHTLAGEKGVLWAGAEQGNLNQKSMQEKVPPSSEDYLLLLNNKTPPRLKVGYDATTTTTPNSPRGVTSPSSSEVVIGSLLHSTDKLVNTHLFEKSTILIVSVDQATGFLGLIVNKHISWDSLNEFEKGFDHLKGAPLSLGGPLAKQGMPLVALTRTRSSSSSRRYVEVVPEVYFIDHLDTLSEIEEIRAKNQSITDHWFFLGYSAWGWDQLFDEITEGAWTVSNDSTRELHFPWT